MFFCIKMFVSGMLSWKDNGLEGNHCTRGGAGPGSASLLLSLRGLFLLELGTTACAALMSSLSGILDLGKGDAPFHSLSSFTTLSIASAVHCSTGEP